MKYIIITCFAGFIGSNFTKLFLKKNKKFNIIGIDKLTYAANRNVLYTFNKNKKFIKTYFKDSLNLEKAIIHNLNMFKK